MNVPQRGLGQKRYPLHYYMADVEDLYPPNRAIQLYSHSPALYEKPKNIG